MTQESIQADLARARRRAAVSVGLNFLLAVGKGITGAVSGSTALISDAIHSATDVLASAAAYIGLWAAGRQHPAFPYGLYKAENISALVASVAVIVAAYEIARQAIFEQRDVPDTTFALPVAALSLLIALVFGLVQLRAGRRLHSPALIADARDYLADAMSTAAVLFGLIAVRFGFNLDRWVAALVALFVFRSGAYLLVAAIRDLLDASIDRETEREIIRLVESHPRISRVRGCMSRSAGGRFIVDLDVVMHTPSHRTADHVADRLEELIPQRFPRVVLARIRPHYAADTLVRRLIPVERPEGPTAEHFARAPWFLLEELDTADNSIRHREFLQNPHRETERQRGLLLGTWILSLKPDEVLMPQGQEGTVATLLRTAGVDVRCPGEGGDTQSSPPISTSM